MAQLIQFTVAPQTDPEGNELRALLAAHLAAERAGRAHQFWVHLLAILGGLIALCMAFPQLSSEPAHEILLALWGVCCAGTVSTAFMERKWRGREAQLLAARPPC